MKKKNKKSREQIARGSQRAKERVVFAYVTHLLLALDEHLSKLACCSFSS